MQNLLKTQNHNIHSAKAIRAVIIGASGYTGAELIRMLLNHPAIKIVALVANQNANSQIEEIYQHLSYYNLPTIVTIDKVDFAQVDVWTGEGATEGNTALVAKGAHAVPSRDEFWLSGFSPAPAVFTADPEQLKLSFD